MQHCDDQPVFISLNCLAGNNVHICIEMRLTVFHYFPKMNIKICLMADSISQ